MTGIFSIKKIKNNSVLVGFYKFLIELNIHEKTFDSKIIYKCEDEIKNVNELSDQRIIVFTNNNILIINKENNEYFLKEKDIIKQNWKIVQFHLKEGGLVNLNNIFLQPNYLIKGFY